MKYEKVDFVNSKATCDFCQQEVNAIDLQLMKIPLSNIKLWGCDECRKIEPDNQVEKKEK